MQPIEVGGTLSSFGPQVLSPKRSNGRYKFGTSAKGQTTAEKHMEFKLLGTTSHGVDTNVKSAFGSQALSKSFTAPSTRFGNRYNSDHDMVKEGRPGPGAYETTSAVGKQPLSIHPNQPAWGSSRGNRFSTYKNVWKEDFQTPAAQDCRPTSGWIGDAPKYSFHGKAKRGDVGTGLPGSKPSNVTNPGPGSYTAPSSMGTQHDSRKSNAWRTRVGTSQRDKIISTQYLSAEHEKGQYGKHSPSPGTYNVSNALVKTSRVSTPQTFKFGSGDRFSQVVPRDRERKLPGFVTPGPGTYVV